MAQGKKRKFDEAINSDDNEATGILECMTTQSSSGSECVTKQGKEPSESEMQALFNNLSCGNTKPVILSLIPQYSQSYVPKSSLGTFPQSLKSLQKPEYINLNYLDLLDVCESTEIQITSEMSMAVRDGTIQGIAVSMHHI